MFFNCNDANAIMSKCGTKYFCILDSKLKEKKGLEFYRKIKRNGPRLKNVECSEFWLRILTVEGKLFGQATFELLHPLPAPQKKKKKKTPNAVNLYNKCTSKSTLCNA